ncbi:RanBP2-type domain-containing protein [Aphelenchoides besseyi]|nr:RanBP2-type domain-containing protein [Aphelenchoides besseyi]
MSGRRGRNRRSSSQDDESPEPEIKRTKRVSQQQSTSQEAVDSDDYEPGSWECSVCTFRNRYEAFKCEMCESRKGTSTRKPRLNQTVVIQQQALAHSLVVQQNQQQSAQQMLTTTASTKKTTKCGQSIAVFTGQQRLVFTGFSTTGKKNF